MYFQHIDRVEVIRDVEDKIHFQAIGGVHSAPLFELAKQVYKFQNLIYGLSEFRADNSELLSAHNARKKMLISRNRQAISLYSQMRP